MKFLQFPLSFFFQLKKFKSAYYYYYYYYYYYEYHHHHMKSYFAYSRSRKNSNKFLTFIIECQKIITSLNCLVFLMSESDMLLFWM